MAETPASVMKNAVTLDALLAGTPASGRSHARVARSQVGGVAAYMSEASGNAGVMVAVDVTPDDAPQTGLLRALFLGSPAVLNNQARMSGATRDG